MKKLTSLQVMMLMSLALGSSFISADYSEKSKKSHKDNHKKQNRDRKVSKAVIMNEEEVVAMESIVVEAQARMDREMGKVPTEHSIKKFIHSAIEDFRASNKDEAAVEAAQFKLSDAQIAIERFTDKLEAVDKHRIASTHSHSLRNKLRNARRYIKDHAQSHVKPQSNLALMNDEPEVMLEESVMMAEPVMMDNDSMDENSDDAMIMNNDSEDSDEIIAA